MCPRAFLNGGHRALIHVLEQKRSQMLSTNYSLALCKKVAIWSKWCLDSFKFNNKKKTTTKKETNWIERKISEKKFYHSIFMWCSTGDEKHDALSSGFVFSNFVFRNRKLGFFSIHEWLLNIIFVWIYKKGHVTQLTQLLRTVKLDHLSFINVF